MTQEAAVAPWSADESIAASLARFFPACTPVRIAVQVTRVAGPQPDPQSTIIEFATTREVLFTSHRPLEFEERIRIRNADGSLDAEAAVVAVQMQSGITVVAARFLENVRNWIVTP